MAIAFTGCTTAKCVAALPAKTAATHGGAAISGYTLGAIDGATAAGLGSGSPAVARFLTQATFGPTKATIAALGDASPGSLEAWIAGQMALAPSLHRAYYRQRTTDRFAFGGRVSPGEGRGPCEVGSRWHNFAFTGGDLESTLDVTGPDSDGKFELRVDGVLRALVDSFAVDASLKPYAICRVEERVGGAVGVGSAADCANTAVDIVNPAITVPAAAASAFHHSFAASDATFADLPNIQDVVLLSALTAGCPAAFAKAGAPRKDMFVTTASTGKTYKLDNRLKLVTNTMDNPATVVGFASGGEVQTAAASGECPTVPKTFVNEATCVRKTTCAATSFTSARFTWNEAAARQFYSVSGKYVYRFEGLRLEGKYQTAVCETNYVSRWWNHSAPCGSGSIGAATAGIDAGTVATVVKALNESTDTANPFVRDVNVKQVADAAASGSQLACATTAATIGMRVEVGGVCWEHVHPDHYDVRDASTWTISPTPATACSVGTSAWQEPTTG